MIHRLHAEHGMGHSDLHLCAFFRWASNNYVVHNDAATVDSDDDEASDADDSLDETYCLEDDQ